MCYIASGKTRRLTVCDTRLDERQVEDGYVCRHMPVLPVLSKNTLLLFAFLKSLSCTNASDKRNL